MNQLVAGQLDEMAPNSWCVLCLRSNWQCVLCFKLGEMRNSSGVFCQDWLFLFTGRLSLRRHDDNLIGMGTDSGFFRTFADFCCWPDGSARYKVKFHHQRCDHCNKVKRGADDQVMKVGAHMETILGRGYLDALDSWWKKTLEDWSHFWQMDIIPPERV